MLQESTEDEEEDEEEENRDDGYELLLAMEEDDDDDTTPVAMDYDALEALERDYQLTLSHERRSPEQIAASRLIDVLLDQYEADIARVERIILLQLIKQEDEEELA